MSRNFGTKIYCPSCKSINACKVIPVQQITSDSKDRFQNKYFIDDEDVNFFQRGRECFICGYEFITYEIDSCIIDELIESRRKMISIKESYNECEPAMKRIDSIIADFD